MFINLRSASKKAGISNTEMAERIGMHRNTYGHKYNHNKFTNEEKEAIYENLDTEVPFEKVFKFYTGRE